MTMIIDTHTHLDEITDPHALLAACAAAGVSDLVVAGTDLDSCRKHLELKVQASGDQRGEKGDLPGAGGPRMHLAFGLHPGNITTPEDTEASLLFIREHIHEAVAVGEMGLDYHYKWVKDSDEKKREQKDAFARQLALACEFSRPAIIHSRAAYRDCLEMARSVGVTRANFHWYTGPLDVLREILDAGYFVSVSPSLAYSPEARAVAAFVPLDRILVETDTPVRGWRPMDVWQTLRLLGGIKAAGEEELLSAVNTNAKTFFGI